MWQLSQVSIETFQVSHLCTAPSHHVEILEMKSFSLLKRQSAFNLMSRNKCGFVFTV